MGSFPSTLALGQSLNSWHLSSFSWKRGELFFLASLASPGLLGLWEVRTGRTPTALPQQAVTSRVRWTLVFRNPVPCSQVRACFPQGQVQEASSERFIVCFFGGAVSFCWPSAGSCPLLRTGCWEHGAGSDKSPMLLTRPPRGNPASAVKATALIARGEAKGGLSAMP